MFLILSHSVFFFFKGVECFSGNLSAGVASSAEELALVMRFGVQLFFQRGATTPSSQKMTRSKNKAEKDIQCVALIGAGCVK